MTKEQILEAIQLTTETNNGTPLGIDKFFEKTGIRKEDWYGKIWVKWSDAVKEAGFKPNTFSSPAYDTEWMLRMVAEYTRELGQFPTKPEFKIKNHNDKSFPTYTTLNKQLGSKAEVISKVAAYCYRTNGFEDVYSICNSLIIEPSSTVSSEQVLDEPLGYVYLIKSGKFFKIGKSNHVGRRNYELSIQLPEKVELIHQIETDDPAGIEKYWHSRFSQKRKNGEWFDLNGEDVKVFKKRKFM